MRRIMFLIAVLFSVTVITACSGSDGSDGRDGQDGAPGVDTSETVWTTKDYKASTNLSCAGCHAGHADMLASPEYILSRMSSAGRTANEALADTSNDKFVYGAHTRAARTSSSCGQCHQQEDAKVNNTTMLTWLGRLNPSANVGGASCVDCHGIENGHYARSTVITPNGEENSNVSASWDSCFQCHASSSSHNPSRGDRYYGKNIGLAFMDGNHIKGYSGSGDDEGNIRDNRVCAYCHTDAYARKYNDFSGSKNDAEISEAYASKGEHTLAGMANTGVGCGTCHNPHSGGLRSDGNVVMDAGPDGDMSTKADNRVVYSSEFLLCTSCHVVMLDTPVPLGTDNAGLRYAYYLDEAVYGDVESINDGAGHHFLGRNGGLSYMGKFVYNHFTTQSGNGIVIDPDGTKGVTAGYNIDAGSRKPCTACHDPHQTTRFAAGELESGNTITEADLRSIGDTYAKSAHGDYTSGAWIRSTGLYSNTCMPCHNGREATKYMENSGNAITPSNAFGGMQSAYSQAATCGTCHEVTAYETRDVSGMLKTTQAIGGAVRMSGDTSFRLPGSATGVNNNLKTEMVAVMAGDNTLVCYTCHGGRTTLDRKNSEYTSLGSGSVSFGSTAHYSPASGILGGTLIPKIKTSTVGTVESRFDYNDRSTWARHYNSNLSCVMCHDVDSSSHTFAVYKDAAGNPMWIGSNGDGTNAKDMYITGNSYADCNSCHSVPAATEKAIEAHLGYRDAVSFLGNKLTSEFGITGSNADWKEATNDIGFYRFVAYQTYSTFNSDPGGYAHGAGFANAAIGESLKKIYDISKSVTNDSTGFRTWMNDLSETGRAWLCGLPDSCGTRYTNDW